MAVFRIEKTRDFTVMSNHHLKNRNLTLKAKGLLSMILSLPDDWHYTTRGLASICKEGVDSISGAIKELEQAGYIVRNRLRDAKGRITDTEYVIHETPVSAPPISQPDMAIPHPASPDTENPDMVKPYPGTTAQYNTKESNTNPEKTKTIQESIYPSHPDLKEMERWRERIRDQIEYEALVEDGSFGRAKVDELVELMTETMCSTKRTISVGGEPYPAEVVKARLSQLENRHILYALTSMKETTSEIRNIRGYLLTVLYNAPTTIENDFQAYFNHDFYGRKGDGKWAG